MKAALAAAALLVLAHWPADAQTAPAAAKPIQVNANFQISIPVDPSATTADLAHALAQANAALGDLAQRQCEMMSAAFKRDCRIVQLNFGANLNARRIGQMSNSDNADARRMANANLNVTMELAGVDAEKNGQAAQ